MLRRRRWCSEKVCSCSPYPHATTCTLDRRCKCKIKTCGPGYYLLNNACVLCPAALTNCATCGPDLKKKSVIICYLCCWQSSALLQLQQDILSTFEILSADEIYRQNREKLFLSCLKFNETDPSWRAFALA